MKLLTLRLSAPLSWTRSHPAALGDSVDRPFSFTLPVLDKEGSEAVFIWPRNQLVQDLEDGPRLHRPLPVPQSAGLSEANNSSVEETARIVLPIGTYLFCQRRLDEPQSVEQILEWFFREAWWTRAPYKDPVYLRLIHEDGKIAVQVIMESD